MTQTPSTPMNSPSSASTLPAGYDPLIGTPLVYIPDGTVFKVLCSCPSSFPRHHTRRHISQNPSDYRHPTVEEIQHHGNS